MPPPLLTPQPQAILALADGTCFHGISIGAPGRTVGEVVFNTAMTGYQEILTDPSYCRQIVTLTYPHIGNYGVNEQDVESSGIQAAGLVIKELPVLESNFRRAERVHRRLACAGGLHAGTGDRSDCMGEGRAQHDGPGSCPSRYLL